MLKVNRTLLLAGAILIIAAAVAYHYFQPVLPSNCEIAPRQETRGNIALNYPQVNSLGKQGDDINKAITAEVENFAAQHQLPDHSGQTTFSVEFNKNHTLSIKLHEFFYVKKAAHPMTYQRAFTFNTKTGQIMGLQDLFRPGSDYLPELDKAAREALAEKQVVFLKPYKGVSANQEFYLTADGLVLYYQLYEYTPYVFGFLELKIPYERLSTLLRPEIIKP